MWIPPADGLLAEAERTVKDADVAIALVGLSGDLENEELPLDIPGFRGGDRTSLDLPETQERLIKAAVAAGKPVIVVLTSGSAMSVNYIDENAAAVLEAWYGGEEAGTAIAETLAGVNNPAGRLPVTFYKNVDQLPPFADYSMKGRTYRYFQADPLYSFGFGLSYSSFQYSALSAKRTRKGAEICATVRNTSTRDGDEVAQLYIEGGTGGEVRNLRGFQRIHLRAGESRQVIFTLGSDDVPRSKVEISVGGGQPLGTISHVKGIL
jgi:beta-glucosidase